MEKQKNILKSLKEIGLTAQVHGIPRIVSNERICLKFLWLVSFLVSASACFYLIQNSLRSFLSYPYLTNLAIVVENPMLFPTVTLCSRKPPVKVYNISDIIIKCEFSNIDCSKEPFFIKTYDFGPSLKTCYQFNLGFKNGSLLSSYRPGSLLGLRLTLFEGIFEEERYDMFGNGSLSTGFQVLIHNKSDFAFSLNDISIQPGVSTFISIHKVITTKLTEPYNNCVKDLSTYHSFDSSLYYQIIKRNYTYTQRDCLDLAFLKTLGCSFWKENCNLTKDFINKLNAGFFNYYQNKTYLKNQDKCPLECDRISFQTKVSHSYFPSYETYEMLLKNTNLISKFSNGVNTSIEEMRKSVYGLSIFFEDLEYTLISEQPKQDIWDIVSSIGGLFGLFLGFSFLSLIDIFQIIFEVFFYSANRIKAQK